MSKTISFEGADCKLNKWKNHLPSGRKGILNTALLLGLSLLMVLPVTANALQVSNRLSGRDRFQTAEVISEQVNAGIVQDVVIASGNNFPDALSASVLAKKLNAPILLVDSTAQGSSEAFKYITQHLSKSGKVHIIGGTGVVGKDFDTQLNQTGYQNIDRIGGVNRYDTSLLIAQKLAAAKNTPVVFVSGANFPDALSISSIASNKGWPILLVGSDQLSPGIKDFVANDQPSQVYIVGGTGVISDDVKSQVQALVSNTTINRLAGQNRLDTNALIIQNFVPSPTCIYLATGYNFADALAGSVLAAKTGDPIVLIDPNSITLPKNTADYLSSISKSNVSVISLGGTSVVSDSLVNEVSQLISGSKESGLSHKAEGTGDSLDWDSIH